MTSWKPDRWLFFFSLALFSLTFLKLSSAGTVGTHFLPSAVMSTRLHEISTTKEIRTREPSITLTTLFSRCPYSFNGQAILWPFWSQPYVPFWILLLPCPRCEPGLSSGFCSSSPPSSRYPTSEFQSSLFSSQSSKIYTSVPGSLLKSRRPFPPLLGQLF